MKQSACPHALVPAESIKAVVTPIDVVKSVREVKKKIIIDSIAPLVADPPNATQPLGKINPFKINNFALTFKPILSYSTQYAGNKIRSLEETIIK